MGVFAVDKLMGEARRLAAEYRRATGQPLAISGEIAKYDAARLLDLEPMQDPTLGYDAVGRSGARAGQRFQIKGRAIFDEGKSGQRIGQVKQEQEWDALLLVLMDENFEPFEIYEARRAEVLEALQDKGDSKRSKRGAMSVARLKIIGRLVWSREEGALQDEIWENHP